MTAPTAHPCPECGGLRLVRDPAGLRWDHRIAETPCSLGRAEAARLAADAELISGASVPEGEPDRAAEQAAVRAIHDLGLDVGPWEVRAPATVERVLFAATDADASRFALVIVSRVTPSLIRRDPITAEGGWINPDALPLPDPTPDPTTETDDDTTTEEQA